MESTEHELVVYIKEKWKRLSEYTSPLGNHYGLYEEPNSNRKIVIHEDDNELVSITIGETTILNPRDIQRIIISLLK